MRVIGLFVSISLMIASIQAQGVSPTGKKDGTALYTAGRKLAVGDYEFISDSKKSLSMVNPKNLLSAVSGNDNSVWELRQHKTTKFFSLHLKNQADLEKCVSTRWTVGDKDSGGGYPDAAVMWQCEIDGSDPKSTGGYQKIYPPKQLWLAVPDQKNRGQYKIVSASHLYDMIPRCISQKAIDGGTTLAECKIDSNDDDLLWTIKKH
ncbi:hypothetical protein BCR42DRAFT_416153 [Absidia repens]|uniref:Ricin B lectin domain-containing protein n=1 Tax=Absidia repens TaxID=90262 RepID=A0A1X2IG71_9FUNG|nr:hypothetical protein BCR42DRAFT_416153 [Absidia repens]